MNGIAENKTIGYKDTIKTNLVFGGVKLLQALVSVLKVKIVAVFLGPYGMGLLSLIESALETMHMFFTCGIFTSGVREIAKSTGLLKQETSIIVLRLSLFLGIIGAVFCVIFSSSLSEFIFGTDKFKNWLMIASGALIFKSLSNGFVTIFQGQRWIQSLAKSSLVGSIAALLICFPLYKFYGENAIPYVVMFSFAVTTLVYLVAIDKKFLKLKIPVNIVEQRSKSILRLGVILVISSCLMALMIFLFNMFISKHGSQEDVGFYQAAQGCTYHILSVLIAILSTDYYPKLSANITCFDSIAKIFNNQVELLVIATSIIVCFIMVFPEFIIHVLYSSEFDKIIIPIQIMSFALVFRIIWHSLSYIILAIGDKYTYLFYDSIIGNGLFFGFNVLGYLLDGINGIAISYCVGSIITALILYLVVLLKYHIEINGNVLKTFSVLVLLLISVLFISNMLSGGYYIVFSVIMVMCIIVYDLYILQLRVGLVSRVLNRLKIKN